MKTVVIGLVASLSVAPSYADEVNLEWDWTLSGSSTTHQDSQLLGDREQTSTQALDALIDVELRAYQWTGLFAAKGSDVLSNSDSSEYKGELIIQELFWQGGLSLMETSIDVTLGKMRLDWGVGYGYRPLDVFKPYRRNPVGIQVEEGTLTAMASYFDEQGDWSLVYSNSKHTQQAGSELEEESQQHGIGLRRYAFVGDSEYQWLAYYDDVRHGLLGGSFVTVLDVSWAMHASAVYQRNYLTYQQGQLLDAVSLDKQSNGYQALVGANWANEIGNNIIVEYWYDSRSWDKSDWQQALDRVDRLSGSNLTASLAPSYAQGLYHANLMAHNVMVHWSLDSSAWSQWQWSQDYLWLNNFTPTADFLYSPQDGALIATQWLDYQAYDSGDMSLNIETALRFMTGDRDSVYANSSDKRMVFINIKGRF
ncbi:hypothetical protein [Vibrio sinaloensis]|uniref:hypothetical protein n=1 Tax=Photobacterium sp. (strain ATCC 43367) TaxID=379097 RepID=UPI002F401B41